MRELAELGLVRSATAEVRVHSAAPLFKLYFLNNEEAFFGFYPVVERNVVVNRGHDTVQLCYETTVPIAPATTPAATVKEIACPTGGS